MPYNTAVEATIQTKKDEAVYSRPYPYPVSMADFVNNEVESLLRDGIIRKSFSPYNSPVLVVRKKGLDSQGNANHRLVIDFRKLNENTISDKYPMLKIPIILSKLGKSKFFSTLDLKSGYHQILLAEKDRKKQLSALITANMNFVGYPSGLKTRPVFSNELSMIYFGRISERSVRYTWMILLYFHQTSAVIWNTFK